MDFADFNRRDLRLIADWLSTHPGARVEDVADAVMPGKITGLRRAQAALFALAAQCRARRDADGRWHAAG
ncbi:hypothetical protein [Streptomyces prunicolor]|uniref:hypothetical protein n=1 Tax=Streptomyces prunicolor TaxID=67348 RepID=UPI0033D80E56